MAGNITREGVELAALGVAKFMSDLKKAGIAWDSTVQRFRDASGKFIKGTDVGPVMEKMTGSVTTASSSMTGLASSMGGLGAAAGVAGIAMGAGIGIAVQAIQSFTDTVKKAISVTKDFLVEGLHLAGRFQEMEFTALAIGRAMGLQEEEIRGAAQAIADQGVRMDAANKIVAQFARSQLDMTDAVKLVSLAQATGIIMDRDSTEETLSLTQAIIGSSTEMLRQRGIFIDNVQAMKTYKEEMGIVGRELNMQEQAQARLNAVLLEGEKVYDVYAAAMESPTKQLRSLTGREIPAFQAALGAPFLDAWATVIGAVRDFVGALTDAVQEGGVLYPVLIKLGAFASIVADGFASALNMVTGWIESFQGEFLGGLGETAEGALRWGVEIIAALAEGISQAATTVLVAAMNFIGNILTSWMGPGSPPKIAPGLPAWGVAAMSEYLHGFTQADFGILKAVQAPLQKILEGPAFAKISQQLIAGISAGKPGEEFFALIAKAAGKFGEEIAELARLEYALVDATEEVAEAEKQLEEARRGVSDAQKDVAQLTREYNTLLRAGEGRAALDIQLAQINAAEENVRLAREQVSEAGKAEADAKSRVGTLKEQTDLQGQIVDQLLALDKTSKDVEKGEEKRTAIARARAKIGKGLVPEMVMPTPAAFDIASRIGEAIDKAKADLKAKFVDIFKPLGDAWDAIKKDVFNLGAVWDKFIVIVGDAWTTLKKKYPILQKVEDWVTGLPEEIKTLVGSWTDETGFMGSIRKVYEYLKDPVFELFKSFGNFLGATGEFAGKGLVWAIEAVLTGWTVVVDYIEENVVPLFGPETGLGKLLLYFKEKRLDLLSEGLEWVKGLIEDVTTKLNEWATAIRNFDWGPLWEAIGQSPSPLEIGLRGVADAMRDLSRVQVPGLNIAAQGAFGTAGATYAPAPQQTYYRSSSVQVGPNHITNSMDEQALAAIIRRVMRREFA